MRSSSGWPAGGEDGVPFAGVFVLGCFERGLGVVESLAEADEGADRVHTGVDALAEGVFDLMGVECSGNTGSLTTPVREPPTATRSDVELMTEAGHGYDSAERRQGQADSLEELADREAVQARLSADQDQATAPTAAVTGAPRRSPKARKAHGANGQTKLFQRGMSR